MTSRVWVPCKQILWVICSIAALSGHLAHASTHHIVEDGETLADIANRYQLTKTALIDANGLEASTLRAGKVLHIPEPNTQHNMYRVVSGDSLSSLSAQYNIDIEQLAHINRISPQSGLMIGSTLIIPVATKTAETPSAPPIAASTTTKKTSANTTAPSHTVAVNNAPSKTARTRSLSASAQTVTTHRIEYGETLSSIAKKYNLSINTLASANQMAIDDPLYFGRMLSIPTQTAPKPQQSSIKTAAAPAVQTYTVQSGDTLMGIANRYGVKFMDIAKLSRISAYDPLAIGQVLTLPPSAALVAQSTTR
ncbi:LysM peptidoglycan-binding domain-containing protein [Psychrobacter aestuarii]|uniref:LysM domain-containing protein n=1 Tax=Psychrobacter aestuarii TaxID=556327 RepID=A0ABN0VP14_9GAMM|nr:LysM peptidoglycan-binding domain-containing protein [Psychrobacter aestuarii]